MRLSINGNKFKVKIAKTPKETQRGMMGRDFDETFNGMLFLMDEGQHCFWMKNCKIFLDIIFIEGDIINSIHHNCRPCLSDDCKNYCGIGNLILEVKGKTCRKLDIKEGDKVLFNL